MTPPEALCAQYDAVCLDSMHISAKPVFPHLGPQRDQVLLVYDRVGRFSPCLAHLAHLSLRMRPKQYDEVGSRLSKVKKTLLKRDVSSI